MDRLWETLPWIVGGLMLALALAAMRRPLGVLARLGLRTGAGLGVLWVLSLTGGALGLRAAGNPGKATGAVIFGLLALVAGIASAVLELNVQNICACVIPLVYFVCAVAVKSSR